VATGIEVLYGRTMASPSRGPRSPTPLPQRKPMATARRVSLFDRRVEVRLAPAAHEILFGAAEVLSEGQVEGDRFVGSTMVTIDLARAASQISDGCDVATARRIAELLPADERARERARGLAVAEARRCAGALDAPQVDLRVRATGRQLHIDLDLEAGLDPEARREVEPRRKP